MGLKPPGTPVSFQKLMGDLLTGVYLPRELRAVEDDFPEIVLLLRFAWHDVLPQHAMINRLHSADGQPFSSHARMGNRRLRPWLWRPSRAASGITNSFNANAFAKLWPALRTVVNAKLSVALRVELEIVGPLLELPEG
ncbi:hypothetical protein HDG34_003097 [Paraburkholderia sp. HC6.4b]|uniref:hypothetical protein n=1 Tax=unclassified Paraburkholderia TaxID=2615204 RepID=UPI00160730EB|nr:MULTISPECIES: hypothetical protein [unclassified Paraburkholderia]MBB5409156.1 hypothetical protein [Paraburkholderia sp. HC6.4b]MBB5450884.1 hypothetical protein [Paraburkholderia sp. Kb1A]